jgi:hypothetical protein
MDVKMAPARLGPVCMLLVLKCHRNRNKLSVTHAAFGDNMLSEVADIGHCAL